MKLLPRLFVWVVFSVHVQCNATSLDLSGYQEEDGAITVRYRGDHVDPYFATRALLTAQESGLAIDESARAWIRWLMPRQESNGLFMRFCRHEDLVWRACSEADADDAMLAMWLQLLYRTAPADGFSVEWRKSATLAALQLRRLVDKATGVYVVSKSNQVGLFMDNVEIFAALRSIADDQQRLHEHAAALATRKQMERLRRNILRVFRPQEGGPFRVSTQPVEPTRFYPEEVAQIYPLLYKMETDDVSTGSAFQDWLQTHGDEWLNQKKDHFPWGLVALTAQYVGDAQTALCWKQRASPLRYGQRWNVLEEAAFQSIHPAEQVDRIPCQEKE